MVNKKYELHYFKATLKGKSWYVSAKARTIEGAKNRLQNAIIGNYAVDMFNKIFSLEPCNIKEYKKGINFDKKYPSELKEFKYF